ncbi:hypothetical protein [Parathalassolituus penaei]|uniref:Uncharacterized protein n=1 Tax=Parathalassolituus penaei TaxID=2997323 RepID=A0A9X3IT38_9GAMM|nr:hypothetical protein [Parathalassolituus penaei]MCY0966486.1 hypothetical protein [Parathalassolituus penaei]
MMKHLHSLILSVILLVTSASASADAEQLLIQLQHMRLASISAMTDFFMFAGLDADSKYERRMDADVESFSQAMTSAREMVAADKLVTHLDAIDTDWQAFQLSLNSNRNLVHNQGATSAQVVEDLARLNNALVTRISESYQNIAGSNTINPAVEKARSMALLLQEMTTKYAASAALNKADVNMGEYKRSLQTMTMDFEFKLADLKSVAYRPQTYILMDNINSKWRFLRNSITRQHEMDVPFLVISYNDRLIRHLEELEGKI